MTMAKSPIDLKNHGRPHAKLYSFAGRGEDGTTALRLTPLELIERLVALIPRPKANLTRYHGVLAPNYKFRKLITPTPEPGTPVSIDRQHEQLELKPKNIPWAKLLARVLKIDVETCPKCNGKMKIIAAIEDPKLIRKILTHLGLPTHQPKLQTARGPPRDH